MDAIYVDVVDDIVWMLYNYVAVIDDIVLMLYMLMS